MENKSYQDRRDKLNHDLYLNFQKVYLQLKILNEKAKLWPNTGLQELNDIADNEKLLEESLQLVKEKLK